ncbi:MAG: asparagine synthase (glutamine-hydrolyzing) [Candidatus Angelobacter sp.]
MCGIAGYISGARRPDLASVGRALELLQHRGPDDAGWLTYSPGSLRTGRSWVAGGDSDPDLVLLHRRLSILDLTTSGWQPMASHDGRYSIVFNGEIYNFLELREELARAGHEFQSRSDTEVLLAAYAEWGKECLGRLIGMFAFAIFDGERRTVFLARDFFGIKPLYYSSSKQQFAFASELKALLELSQAPRHVNSSSLLLYLRHGLSDQGAATLLSDVHQLPAAHCMEISLDRTETAQPIRYWQPEITPTDISFDEAAARLRDLFLESIRLHLRSDVPVGAALSGGIDSSAIVAAMRTVVPGLEIHAFSYIADDARLSEEKWIDSMVQRTGAHSHKVRANSQELVRDLDKLLSVQEEPFGSTSIYAQNRVFRLASEAGIKVMLDGQGADELLGGYRYYLAARFASLIRQHRFAEALRFLRNASHLPNTSAMTVALWTADYLIPARWQKPLRALIAKEFTPRWVNSRWFQERGETPVKVNYCRDQHVLRFALLRTLSDTSLPHLLRYEDRNSMAFSIESRVPFLTPELANFVLSLPENYIVADDGTSKAVFRKAMRGIVPDEILDRKDKIGFATPEQEWLRVIDGWVQQTLHSEAAASMPFLNRTSMQREWEAIIQGRQAFDNRVWRWLNIIRWSQQFQLDYSG